MQFRSSSCSYYQVINEINFFFWWVLIVCVVFSLGDPNSIDVNVRKLMDESVITTQDCLILNWVFIFGGQFVFGRLY